MADVGDRQQGGQPLAEGFMRERQGSGLSTEQKLQFPVRPKGRPHGGPIPDSNPRSS